MSSISNTGDGKGGMMGQHFRVLEWIFLQIQPKTSVQTWAEAIAELVHEGCSRSIEISGQKPGDLPGSTQDHLEWCLQQSIPYKKLC